MGLAAATAVILWVLPASVLTHFLPDTVKLEELSGTLWHGSAQKLRVEGRDSGSVEWVLHPSGLLYFKLVADLHWVKSGVQIDGSIVLDKSNFEIHNLRGNGPIEDLRDFGVPSGWIGQADIHLNPVAGTFTRITRVSGDIKVEQIASAQIANGTSLGGYNLHFPNNLDPSNSTPLGGSAVDASDIINLSLTDLGGPVEAKASVKLVMTEHTATLTGTVKARSDAPASLQEEIQRLAQMRGRDAQGGVPVDVEFTF